MLRYLRKPPSSWRRSNINSARKTSRFTSTFSSFWFCYCSFSGYLVASEGMIVANKNRQLQISNLNNINSVENNTHCFKSNTKNCLSTTRTIIANEQGLNERKCYRNGNWTMRNTKTTHCGNRHQAGGF